MAWKRSLLRRYVHQIKIHRSLPAEDAITLRPDDPLPDPPVKQHAPELVRCAFCGYLIEDAWWPYHPCPEREQALAERERLNRAVKRDELR